MIGNGHACTLSESDLTDERKAGQNLIRMGSTADTIQPDSFEWTDAGIKLNRQSYAQLRSAVRTARG